MAARKKTTAKRAVTKGKTAKKPASRKAAPAKAAKGRKGPAKKVPAKKASARNGLKKKGKSEKTRAQALAEARKKITRKAKTPRIGRRAADRALEITQQVIQAYAAASREMAEWLAAARRSDKTA